MKSRTIVIKRKYLLFILIISIVLLICFFVNKNKLKDSTENIVENNILEESANNISLPVSATNYKKKVAYVNIPKNVGRI